MITLFIFIVGIALVVGGLVSLMAMVAERARWWGITRDAARRQKALDRQWARDFPNRRA